MVAMLKLEIKMPQYLTWLTADCNWWCMSFPQCYNSPNESIHLKLLRKAIHVPVAFKAGIQDRRTPEVEQTSIFVRFLYSTFSTWFDADFL